MKDIAEAAGSVYEIEFLDTGQVGLDVTVEDHCSRGVDQPGAEGVCGEGNHRRGCSVCIR